MELRSPHITRAYHKLIKKNGVKRVIQIWRYVCVSLGLDRKILLTEDRARDILEKTGLQETSQPQEETSLNDVQSVALPLDRSGKRGELGDRINHPFEEMEKSPGWQRLPIVKKRCSWLDIEVSTLKLGRSTACTEGMKGVPY
jgi:hypothetical protein